jgi:ribose-phosphate pyrophosphokinase
MEADALLLFFADEAAAAQRIAHAAAMQCAPIHRHRFPDGELKLLLPEVLPPRVVILRSLNHPNEKLIELLLSARTARTLGARHLTLLAPYLAYMRQDKAFRPGEAISQTVVGGFLASMVDAVITVDPHLHRINSLQQAIPAEQTIVISGAPLLADLIASHHADPLLLGPDEESEQWVALAAARHHFEHAVCTKQRLGDRDVNMSLPDRPVRGRAVVLLDDVASSGHTLATATALLLAAGAASVDVAVTHALFAGDAISQLHQAGVDRVWSTDCVQHESNAVSMAAPIAQVLMNL